MRTEPDNCTPRLLPPARSGEGQYCAILASLQAVRPRCAAGAAPGPRLRVPHAPNTPETTRKTVTTNHKPRLDQFRRFRDDPGDLDGPNRCTARAGQRTPDSRAAQKHHDDKITITESLRIQRIAAPT